MPAWTWPPSPALVLLMWPLITAIISLFYGYLDKNPRTHAILAILVKAGVDLPAILDAVKRLVTGQSIASQRAVALMKLSDSPQEAASKLKPLGMIVMLGALVFLFAGCLPPPTVPVTPTNSAQVSSCQGLAALHNDTFVTDLALGVAGTGLGAVAAADTTANSSTRVGFSIGSAALAGLAAIGAVIVGYSGQEYAVGNCSEVVPIPTGGAR